MKTYYIKSDGGVMFDYDLTDNQDGARLTKLQKAVGGYIEYVATPFQDTKVIANEEGLLHKLPPNIIATGICQKVIVGDVIGETSNPSVMEYIVKCSVVGSISEN